MKPWKFVSGFGILLAAAALTAPSATAKDLKLGGVHSPTSFETQALNKFAELVAEKSGGDLKIKVYPAGQLGDAVGMIENVILGAQDMFANVADWNQHLVKDFAVLAMPFAIRDLDHLKRFQASGVYADLKKQLIETKQIRVLADNWYRLPRVLVTTQPVKSVDDLAGRKLRMPNLDTYIQAWKALGTKPTVIPWAEAYLAMKTGIVEGMDSPISSIYPQKFYEAAKYITITNHAIAPFNLLISEKVFAKLPKAQQDILAAAGKEAGEFYTRILNDTFAEHRQKMEKAGAKFETIDLKPFAARAREAAVEFEAKGLWSKGLFDAIQKM